MVKIVKSPTLINFKPGYNLEAKLRSKLFWGDLNGTTWMKWSISIWNIIKSPEEMKLKHPAMFPVQLCERLIRLYTRIGDVVLDPFLGTGSTLIAAKKLGRKGIGFEIYDYFVSIAKERLERQKVEVLSLLMGKQIPFSKTGELNKLKDEISIELFSLDLEPIIIVDDARNLDKYLPVNSVNLCLTSPPYFNIHRRERTSDRKIERPYGDDERDLGNIDDYDLFLLELKKCFKKVYQVLKQKAICIVIVMDIRESNRFYPLHTDVINFMKDIGYKIEDIIIWDRRLEYSNIRPLGYPYKFIVNKIHEYILIFKKP